MAGRRLGRVAARALPALDQLATDYEGKVKITKLDVDANIKTGSRFNVRSIPTLLFFKDGKQVDQIIGAVPKARIEAVLQKHAPAAAGQTKTA